MNLPNKPMLPTATTWLNENPSGPLRRQTGQSLGSFDEWRATALEEQDVGRNQRATVSGQRTTGDETTREGRPASIVGSKDVRADGSTYAATSEGGPVLPSTSAGRSVVRAVGWEKPIAVEVHAHGPARGLSEAGRSIVTPGT